MAVKIQIRRDLASVWTSVNPVLSAGEFGVETDTLFVKIGNGTTAWVSLAYVSVNELSALHYEKTLVVATWAGSAAPYSYALTITDILSTDKPFVDFIASTTYATALLEEADWLNVYKVVSSTDTITLYAHEKPTVALDINIEVIR
jgi:hypothetical protein